MREWTYKSSGGEAYPVRVNDIWQAGRHRLSCGDLERNAPARLLRSFDAVPDLVYVDPPWNAGNAAAFRTKAQVPHKVNFSDFLIELVGTVRVVRRYAFIEMGNQNADLLVAIIDGTGGTVLSRWPITYYDKFPCMLLCATWTGQPHPGCDLTGKDDENTPYLALQAVGVTGETVFDPCLGRGNTARSAEKLGMTCYGNELSPFRLSAALHSLARMGLTVSRVGSLEEEARASA